jgi:hypothetical protein
MEHETGWKPIPLSLKIVSVLYLFWIIMSAMRLGQIYEAGIPILGVMTTGFTPVIVAFLLDVAGPAIFLFGLWKRFGWAWGFTLAFMSLFVLNSAFAFVTLREDLGVPAILIPTAVILGFIVVVFTNKDYFQPRVPSQAT